jgi:DNA-binding transcriptional ArsR family regulator
LAIWLYYQMCKKEGDEGMDSKTQARFEARARIVKAMAHPTRLFIVDALSSGEKCVCELTEMVGADVSTISKHLSILRNAGIIRDSKRGQWVWYRLACPCILSFFDCVESVIRTTAEEQLEVA